MSSDTFKDCLVPTLFAVGTESQLSSVLYTEVSFDQEGEIMEGEGLIYPY